MADILHSDLTDPFIHEPKGVSTAAANSVYLANGSGSGSWGSTKFVVQGVTGYNATTPIYTHNVTTSFTFIDPAFNLVSDVYSPAFPNQVYTAASSPAKLTYTGSPDLIGAFNFEMSFKNAAGTSHDLEIALYKNGNILTNSRRITTAVSGEWRTLNMHHLEPMSTNDEFTLGVQGDSNFTVELAIASLSIHGYYQ